MAQASRRFCIVAALAALGGTTWWLWDFGDWQDERAQDGVVIVTAPVTSAPNPERAVARSSPSPSATPRAADPVVAARRDMPVLVAVAATAVPDMNVLDKAMTRQARNASTAGPTETAMREVLMNVPTLTGGSEAPRVLCVDTTCEVTGVAAAGRSPAEVEKALRDPAMLNAMVRQGYMPGPVRTAITAGGGVSYILYLNDEMGDRATPATG
jgi:hypothetical protein